MAFLFSNAAVLILTFANVDIPVTDYNKLLKNHLVLLKEFLFFAVLH